MICSALLITMVMLKYGCHVAGIENETTWKSPTLFGHFLEEFFVLMKVLVSLLVVIGLMLVCGSKLFAPLTGIAIELLARDVIQELKAQVTSQEKKNEKVARHYLKLQNKCDVQTRQIKEWDAHIGRLTLDADRSEIRVADSAAEIQRQAALIDDLEAELEGQKERAAQFEAEVLEEQALKARTTRENVRLRARKAQLKEDVRSLEARNAELAETARRLQVRLEYTANPLRFGKPWETYEDETLVKVLVATQGDKFGQKCSEWIATQPELQLHRPRRGIQERIAIIRKDDVFLETCTTEIQRTNLKKVNKKSPFQSPSEEAAREIPCSSFAL